MNLFKNTTFIAVVALFVVGMFVYNMFFRSAVTADPSTSPTVVGADLIKISGDLSKATLNQSIFSDPLYVNLLDFSTAVVEQPTGRANPFDIIGRN